MFDRTLLLTFPYDPSSLLSAPINIDRFLACVKSDVTIFPKCLTFGALLHAVRLVLNATL